MNLLIFHSPMHRFIFLRVIGFTLMLSPCSALELTGLSVTPHTQSSNMRYRRLPDPELGARVELFLRNDGEAPLGMGPDFAARFDGQTPTELLESGASAWHDTPGARNESSITLQPGAMTVWTFNSRGAKWGAETVHQLELGGAPAKVIALPLATPQAWLSAVTFLGAGDSVTPTRAVVHVASASDQPLTMRACRLWIPASNAEFRVLRPQEWQTKMAFFPATKVIPAGGKGGFVMETGSLPLTYCAVEVQVTGSDDKLTSLWAHLRIKREAFDLSGGWVVSELRSGNSLQAEPYLKTLRRMHINAGMHDAVPGYTDNETLYAKYPLKYMNRLQPFERYDTDAVLPRIHAVEFLGEPQFGGDRAMRPQEVFAKLAPYGPTRMPTSVTLSSEREWRYYAGLSDYPHYDAYRVTAPAPDSWASYDRWGGEKIGWGAPLETIGDMTRSLRDLNRPRPIAYWSQGAHYDWGGWFGFAGRKRASPTPDELRAQAYHSLAHRITSLYWFNLSLKSLVKFPDLIDPITRVNREIRLLEDFFLEGDATHYERILREGQPDWDLAVIAGPRGAVLFALDLAYKPDAEAKVFKFGPPREVSLTWPLPAYLGAAKTLLRVDADGITPMEDERAGGRISLRTLCGPVNVFVLSPDPNAAESIEARRRALIAFEESFDFDPARRAADLETLRALAGGSR